MSDQAWIDALKAKGHVPIMENLEEPDEVGDLFILDVWVMNNGIHNGPGCETCGMSWCEHCIRPENIEPCSSPVIEAVAEPVPRLLK